MIPASGWLAAWLFVAVVCGVVSHEIGDARGRGERAFLYGFILGPLGWVWLLVRPPTIEAEARRACS
jgi:biotin transporter BioY